MAHSYTPGLAVTPWSATIKKRILPIPGEVLVRAGQQVASETVVARAELPGKVHVINIVNQLGISPEDLKEFMVKGEGDKVEKGDVLAENKPFIKWFKSSVSSPVAGSVETISNSTGQVLLREPPRRLDLFSYVDGLVIEVIPGQGARIETTCALIQGIFGVGGETWGPLAMLATSPEAIMSEGQLTPAHAGKIVVGGAFVEAAALERAKSIGVKGLIVGGMHDKDLRTLLGYDLGVAITGTESFGFTLVLTEGFGHIPMATKTYELLKTLEGRKASMSGATQIRAGVIRPEIIVPRQADEAIGSPTAHLKAGAKIGDPVRIIREPFFGRIGAVVALPSELATIPTESQVRVMEIQFADGTKAMVPRANIEIIEET